MQFLYPQFLWALLALAIPIIIHLFHFRRFKKVYFTNVRLLRELQLETSNRSRLRSLLILLARCLALAALVMAFAQPIIRNSAVETSGNRNLVAVFVDNSFSMNATKDEVPLLTIARDKAREIVSAYRDFDRFLLMTHDLEPKHMRVVDQHTMLNFIDQIRETPRVSDLSQVSAIVDRLVREESEYDKYYYVLSDFQKNISVFDTPLDSMIAVQMVPIRAVQENNVAIVHAAFDAPVPVVGQNNTLLVHYKNNGENTEDVELRMNYAGQERPLGTIRINPNEEYIDTVAIRIDRPGRHDIELIIADYPIVFDDHFYLSFDIADRHSVLSIYEGSGSAFVRNAINNIPNFELVQISKNAIRFNEFAKYRLIIIEDISEYSSGLVSELVSYVKNGGNLLIFPNASANPSSINSLLGGLNADQLGRIREDTREVSRINQDDFIFNDVYETVRQNLRLPSVKRSFDLTLSSAISRDYLMLYRDGGAYISKYGRQQGFLYLCSAPLSREYNDLVLHAEIFVPMLYKMTLVNGPATVLYYSIGENQLIPNKQVLSGESGQYRLALGQIEFIPGITAISNVGVIDVRDQVTQAGVWTLTKNEQEISRIAFNYDRKESDVRYGSIEEIAQRIGYTVWVMGEADLADISSYVSLQTDGKRMWRWFIIIALLFLLIETLLIRFWK